MADEMARQQGAAGLMGQEQFAGGQSLGYGALGGNANQAILGGPQKPGVGGILGGLAMQGLKTASAFA